MLSDPIVPLPYTENAVTVLPELQAIHDAYTPLLQLLPLCCSELGLKMQSDCNVEPQPAGSLSPSRSVSMEFLLSPPATTSGPDEEDLGVLRELEGRLTQLSSWLSMSELRETEYYQCVQEECLGRAALEEEWVQWVKCMAVQQLPPAVAKALKVIEGDEGLEREQVEHEYGRFCRWVWESRPLWISEAHRKEEDQARRQAALQAAKESLERELLGRGGVRQPLSEGGPSSNLHPQSSPFDHSVLQHTAPEYRGAVRQQAIALLSQEESAMRLKRTEKMAFLEQEEKRLKSEIEARAAEQRRATRAQTYENALEHEQAVRARIEARERLAAIRREERGILLEHLRAEEAILRERIQGYERARQEKEAAAKAAAELEKRKLAQRLRVEEELLQERLEEHRQMKMAQAAALAKARAEQEAEAWRQYTLQQEEEREAKALEASRAALLQREEMLERRRALRYGGGGMSDAPYFPPPHVDAAGVRRPPLPYPPAPGYPSPYSGLAGYTGPR